jgi:hypothetical protein
MLADRKYLRPFSKYKFEMCSSLVPTIERNLPGLQFDAERKKEDNNVKITVKGIE